MCVTEKQKQRKSRIFSNVLFALKWQFRINPGYTALRLCRMLFDELVLLAEHTFLPAYIISCIEQQRGLGAVLQLAIPVAIAVAVKVIGGPLIDNYLTPKANIKFYQAVRMTLYAKAATLEISKYDDSEFYNDFVWAMHRAPEHIEKACITTFRLLCILLSTIITGGFIISSDANALVVIAVMTVSTVLLQRAITRRNMRREEELMPVSRKRDYCNRVFYLADYVKDMKTGDMADKLKQDFHESSGQMEREIVRHGKVITGLSMLRDGISLIAYDGVYMTYLFYQALVKNKYTLGTLLAMYNAANRLYNSLRRAFMMLPQFEESSLYIEKLRTFLETDNAMPDSGTLPTPSHGDLALDNVHFTYAGNDAPTIKGVTMHIKKGEKVALVGFNGAGKSTLIKLLLRLYDPDSGVIRYGGEDIRQYPLADYRAGFSALFQDFEIIAAGIGDNLTMSGEPLDEAQANEALKKAAFWDKFQTLPDGYDTQLTKEFNENGINLSGGEAQKIAVARVLYADAGVLVLDEPSSALDPIAEYTLNKTVTELAEDKTVIIISHRLSTTRFVDKIFMLEDGRVIEQGSHDALLAQDGQYAAMFRLQAEKYR